MRLILFFSTFALLYAALHGYVLWKARRAFRFGAALKWGSGLFILFMLSAFFLVRLLERWGYAWPAQKLAYVGYTWMGFLFLLFCACLAEDLYRLGTAAAEALLKKDLSRWRWSPRHAFPAVFLCAAGLTVYGHFEALNIRTEYMEIGTSKIPAKAGRIRIVQISDIHLGLMVREARVRRILEKVTAARPDILVSTGDLVDGEADSLMGVSALFRRVPARHGKIAVTGNHEYYAGIRKSLALTESAGFTVLRGEARHVLPGLSVAGVDDPAGTGDALYRRVSERSLIDSLPQEDFRLLLKHRPLLDEEAAGHFDLQLSGHTHKGQIFPFTLVLKPMYPTLAGLLGLPKGSLLYVSRGTGTWGPPIRFLVPPEVTVIDLVPTPSQPAMSVKVRNQ
ncbi:MAG: metallophosphoesterase [Thermodesulfobacteriota bacterium]